MTYYKASVNFAVESINEDGSVDLDSYIDNGIIEVIQSPTVDGLKAKLDKRFDLSLFEEIDDTLVRFINDSTTLEIYTVYVTKVHEVSQNIKGWAK